MRVLKVNKENTKNILSDLLKRSPNNYDKYAGTVQGILDEIKEKGDEALFAYTEKFDKCKLTKDTIQVTEEEIKAAYEKVDDSCCGDSGDSGYRFCGEGRERQETDRAAERNGPAGSDG